MNANPPAIGGNQPYTYSGSVFGLLGTGFVIPRIVGAEIGDIDSMTFYISCPALVRMKDGSKRTIFEGRDEAGVYWRIE